MEIRRLPADETAVRRYVERLWLPYHRELESTVEPHSLADDADLVAEETAFRLDGLEAGDHRVWVAVDDSTSAESADVFDGELAGFVAARVAESPPVFDRPDPLVVGDIYVRERYRGTGLARDLIDRAAERAREGGCAELALDVDVENDRARSFYEKLGFEARRVRMTAPVEEL